MADEMPVILPNPLPGPDPIDLPHLLRRHGADDGARTALIDGADRWTWSDLADAMQSCAAYLTTCGVGPGDRVASLGGVTAAHLIAYLGTLSAGATMAPLPVTATPDAVARMVRNCAPRVIFADAAGTGSRGDLQPHPLDSLLREIAHIDPAPPRPIAPHDGFDIIYSSGTTGEPKGIMHDHLFRGRQRMRLGDAGFDRTAVTLVSTPMYSNTTLAALLPALAGGGTVVLQRKFDAGDWLALAADHRVTHAMCVPVQWKRILDHPGFAGTDLGAFRQRLSTSAPLRADLARRLLDEMPGDLRNIYGMTEGGVGLLLDARRHPDKLHTVGRPVDGADLMILGPDDAPVAKGETGEIVGRSATMMTGYCNAPDQTRAALWVAPDGRAWMRSGDMGRLDEDGFLIVLDRTRDMINSGGFNVFAVDLERVLLDHPDVSEAAVIAIPSDAWGETPLGIVVGDVDPAGLRDWANARLGKTQRLARIEVRDALPRSDIGKVLKRELRAPYWPAPPKETT